MASTFRNICSALPYGNEGRKKWTQVGTLIEKDGKFYIKLTHLPLFTAGQGDDGIFLSVFDQNNNNRQDSTQVAPEGLDDDIPF